MLLGSFLLDPELRGGFRENGDLSDFVGIWRILRYETSLFLRVAWAGRGCFFKTGQRRVLRRGAGGASCIEVQMERALASCCGGTWRGPGLGLAVWSLGFPGWGFGGKSGFRGKQRFFSRRRIWILGDGTFPSSKRRGDGEGCFFKTGQRRVLRSGHGAS